MAALMTGEAVAQPVSAEHQARIDQTRRQLRSSDAADVSWGAFNAMSFRLVELAPELAEALERRPATAAGVADDAVIMSLLDAVAQLGTPVPAIVLERHWARGPVQTAIAMANATGDRDHVLLRLLDSSKGFEWFAAANLLARSRADGFVARLLARLSLRLVLDVSDEGRVTAVEGRGSFGVGDGIGVLPDGFPPQASYRFELGPQAGTVVLSTGPQTLYYSRTIINVFRQYGVSMTFTGGPDTVDRMLYLQWLLRPYAPASAAERMAVHREAVAWRGGEDLIRRGREAVEGMRTRYRLLLNELVREDLLSSDEAARFAEPAIDVEVLDRRTDTSVPLPAFP